jgi:8-oxo-dGTP diphosphatase
MILVTCAIIRNEDEDVLVVQRGEATDHPFKWEFPGGKLNAGETDEECIIREIAEELSMEIVINGKLKHVDHDYGHKQIRLVPFICDTLDEMPFLTEHIAYKWVNEKDLLSLDFSEADVFVAQSYLEKNGKEKSGYKGDAVIPAENLNDNADFKNVLVNMMSSREADWIAASAIENADMFRRLYEYSFSSDQRLGLRASWTLNKACDQCPELIDPYIDKIVDALANIKNESALRSFLRILSLTELHKIKPVQHGILADFCFSILNSGFSSIANKAYSMEILYKLTLIYPELANELTGSILILMEDGSAGIISRGRHILRKLANLNKT